MSRHKNEDPFLTRRSLLKTMGLAPLVLRPAPSADPHCCLGLHWSLRYEKSAFPFSEVRLTPHYPAKSPLEDVLRLVAPGSDEYVTEKYAFEIGTLLQQWSEALRASVLDLAIVAKSLDPAIEATAMVPEKELTLRSGNGIDCRRRRFSGNIVSGRERFLEDLRLWLGQVARVETAEFEITSIEEIASAPLAVRLEIRYDLVAARNNEAARGAGRILAYRVVAR